MPECGKKRPLPAQEWDCPQCGAKNSGKFCTECGTKKPEGNYFHCDKCGYEQDDVGTMKFCPQCGDKIDQNDLQ